ncbi:balbiani ring protein 3-like [Lineus longissimus]|uniref:balbiani ring protein 3-like n=1 Tax=Lineus longissimus TaxID=88925 RepID=UPI002B4F6B85
MLRLVIFVSLFGIFSVAASSVYERGLQVEAGYFSLNCSIDTMPACKPITDDCSRIGCFKTGLIKRKKGCCQLVCICKPEVPKCPASSHFCEECASNCHRYGKAWWFEEKACCVQPCNCPLNKCKNELADDWCDDYARAGHCESNPTYMKVYCTKSCRSCNIWKEGNCENKLNDNLLCRRYFLAGNCKVSSWTRENCARACNSCGQA